MTPFPAVNLGKNEWIEDKIAWSTHSNVTWNGVFSLFIIIMQCQQLHLPTEAVNGRRKCCLQQNSLYLLLAIIEREVVVIGGQRGLKSLWWEELVCISLSSQIYLQIWIYIEIVGLLEKEAGTLTPSPPPQVLLTWAIHHSLLVSNPLILDHSQPIKPESLGWAGITF